MGWRELLQEPDERIVLPWLGGGTVRSATRTWSILAASAPVDRGWYSWKVLGRRVQLIGPVTFQPDALQAATQLQGYLVGDWLVADGVTGFTNFTPEKLGQCGERVQLLDPGLERFTRIAAGRMYENGPLLFWLQLMPLGPEDEVLRAFLDHQDSVAHIKGVPPALDAAFRLEVWRRQEADRRRAELERQHREAEEQRARAARRQELVRKLGDGAGRREMAAVDFHAAATAALAVGGAELLDERKGQRGERVVRYRIDGRRFECVCNERTLRIVDAGICLTDHDTDERGDTYFTLESLPAVVREAEQRGKLVVFRHV
jgi:hypothetical protein